MPVPVDSKYINPAHLPRRQTLSFPKVNQTGYMLGWGQKDANYLNPVNNNLLQEIKLTTANRATSPCNDLYPSNSDAPYTVTF